MAPAKPRRSFTAAFKLKVTTFAKKNGNRVAGREFDINERCVRDWRKQEAILKTLPRAKRAQRHGKVKCSTFEDSSSRSSMETVEALQQGQLISPTAEMKLPIIRKVKSEVDFQDNDQSLPNAADPMPSPVAVEEEIPQAHNDSTAAAPTGTSGPSMEYVEALQQGQLISPTAETKLPIILKVKSEVDFEDNDQSLPNAADLMPSPAAVEGEIPQAPNDSAAAAPAIEPNRTHRTIDVQTEIIDVTRRLAEEQEKASVALTLVASSLERMAQAAERRALAEERRSDYEGRRTLHQAEILEKFVVAVEKLSKALTNHQQRKWRFLLLKYTENGEKMEKISYLNSSSKQIQSMTTNISINTETPKVEKI